MWKITSINPHNNKENASFDLFTDQEILEKINQAHSSYKSWSRTSIAHRAELFHKLSDVIEKDIDALAELQTREMWMLLSASKSWLKSTLHLIRWFADNAEQVLWEQEFERDGETGKIMYDPLGVIYGIAPWNFPFNQVLRAAVPNILAGNTQVYKHASNVPLCGARIESLFLEAGFPEGVYINMFISSSKSEMILSDSRIQWVNLTGSEWAGSSIGALAGKYLKPSILELGGNDAFIVATNDRIDEIAHHAMKARIANNGEKCNSSKRFIVPEMYYESFVESAKKHMESFVVWNPMNEDTDLGPLARPDLRDEVHNQVQKTLSEGARLVTGWNKIPWDGNYYEATILADVTKDMTSYKEEVFGPVASIIKVADIEEAIQVANDSEFGLCGCVYWDDESELKYIASQIHTGMMFLNKPAGSRASLPFGGVKKSWYGKENGPEGLRAFTNKKVIVY